MRESDEISEHHTARMQCGSCKHRTLDRRQRKLVIGAQALRRQFV